MLLDDPELSGVGAVVFDEFHERRLSSDLSLARVLDLQESVRPRSAGGGDVCDA
jgi:ATP-dependent helicase HrpB